MTTLKACGPAKKGNKMPRPNEASSYHVKPREEEQRVVYEHQVPLSPSYATNKGYLPQEPWPEAAPVAQVGWVTAEETQEEAPLPHGFALHREAQEGVQQCRATQAQARDRDHRELVMIAESEGVLESRLHTDGCWYIELGRGLWKEARSDFWCTHCEVWLATTEVAAHVAGEAHRRIESGEQRRRDEPGVMHRRRDELAEQRRRDEFAEQRRRTDAAETRQRAQSSSMASASATTSASSSSSRPANITHGPFDASSLQSRQPQKEQTAPVCKQFARSGNLERWQKLEGSDGTIRCMACHKVCDGYHEHTQDHAKKVAIFIESLENRYEEPEDPWLCWMECKECGDGRFLRCLLCNKWIQDFEGTDPRNYEGQHSRLSNKNQKDHYRKMRNLSLYMNDATFWGQLLAERAKWHPPRKAASASSPSKLQGVSNAPGVWDLSRVAPQQPVLPDGWYSQWCPSRQQYYYWSQYHRTQWEVPTVAAHVADLLAADAVDLEGYHIAPSAGTPLSRRR